MFKAIVFAAILAFAMAAPEPKAKPGLVAAAYTAPYAYSAPVVSAYSAPVVPGYHAPVVSTYHGVAAPAVAAAYHAPGVAAAYHAPVVVG